MASILAKIASRLILGWNLNIFPKELCTNVITSGKLATSVSK